MRGMRGILWHDIYSGIVKNWGKILLGIIIFAMAGMAAVVMGRNFGVRNLTWSEIVSYVFAGVLPYQESREKGMAFQIPLVWLILQIYMAYIISVYPMHDLKTYGVNMLLKVKNRGKWWTGKVIWAVLVNIVIYAAGYVVMFIIAAINGGMGNGILTVRQKMTDMVTDVDITGLSMGQEIVVLIVLPLLTSIVLSVLQLAIIISFSEAVAYGFVLFMCVAGAYYGLPVLFTGFSMCRRTIEYVLMGNLSMVFVILAAVVALSYAAGRIVMNRKDIYEN